MFFLPLLLMVYYFFKKRKIRNIILLIFSLFFYAWGEPKYIFLLIISIIFNYGIGIFLDKKKKNKYILALGIVINLLLIFVFKYLDLGVSIINHVLDKQLSYFNIMIPIGISFYTFQVISYIVDVYRGKVKAEKNILNLGLYVALFPQLIAGPIVKYNEINEQIINRKENFNKFYDGVKRFMIGFVKKIVIANNMAIICDTIYNFQGSQSMPILWLAAIAFALNIYYDFSGYSDMAIGLGGMFGFKIPENFNYPYAAWNISDFWRRWHISLSSWFKEYVYIPLGGNRVSKLKMIRNLLVVFVLTGLWHGASYNFIIWGLYYGFFIIIEKLFLKNIYKKSKKTKPILYLVNMIIIIIGWVIFRIHDIKKLPIILMRMFDVSSWNKLDFLYSNYKLVLALLYLPVAVLFAYPVGKVFLPLKKGKNHVVIEALSFMVVFVLYIWALVLMLNDSYKYFIYFDF